MEGSRSQAPAARSQPGNIAPGTVALVGAGPGDPGLITLRGVECLAAADVVLYDYLANARLLEHCRADAVLVCLGKHGRDRILTQDEINARMTAEGLSGKRVVRLKGGDPAVFARLRLEIITQLRSHAGVVLYEICTRYKDVGRTARQPWRWWRRCRHVGCAAARQRTVRRGPSSRAP